MIRVLITDDSDTARGLLAEILRGDPEIWWSARLAMGPRPCG